MAELPAARPSIPSVKFAPFDTAVTINITMGINISHPILAREGSILVNISV